MSNIKKLASQTAVYGLGSVLPRVITFLYSFILTYIFKQPSELSANIEFYSYISFLNILFTSSYFPLTLSIITRYYPINRATLRDTEDRLF